MLPSSGLEHARLGRSSSSSLWRRRAAVNLVDAAGTVSTVARRRADLFPALLFFSGYCGISYEVLYARYLGNMVGDQFAVVASVLLTFLLGIGLGTLVAHRLWRFLWAIEAGVGLYAVVLTVG